MMLPSWEPFHATATEGGHADGYVGGLVRT
jgi:hypothetical protein